ncbi:hypothetical protein FGK63_07665 [Ruegeria sediminis]|uniref:Translation initiation factor 2 n=1 Tax=Ruegeria sediminis TaxID=2583820 RepID=A0ABY2X274_9RHOB|nr:hypothetical protein [Ruegeria sediminis]TMV08988.1 hypothetical protein FGK63_07665 [Ruegeria sediminis]
MKPAFALSLSIDGIALLHRTDGGWLLVGTVPVDAPGLKEAMRDLRDRAAALDDDTRCKIIIPNDQVRYLAVETGDLPEDERLDAVRAKLAEAIPYSLSEIVLDTVQDGPITHAAAVAKLTLDEANGFAVEQGFQPVSYVAKPSPEDYPGEPFFGLSPLGKQLTGSDAVEPDGIAVEVIGEVEPAESTKENTGEARSDKSAEDDTVEAGLAESDKTATAEEPAATDAAIAPVQETETEPESQAATADPAEPDKPTPDAPTIHPIAEPASPKAFAAQRLPGSEDMDEAQRMTIFGARNQTPAKRRLLVPALAAGAVVVTAVIGWALLFPGDEPFAPADEETRIIADATPSPGGDKAKVFADDDEVPADALPPAAKQPPQENTDPDTDLTATDTAVLDALSIEPQTIERVGEEDPEGEQDVYSSEELLAEAPQAPEAPGSDPAIDLYVSSIDHADLSQDAVALPKAQEFGTDAPLEQVSLPVSAGTRFELDDRGLVAPSEQGTLNPDGVMVYLGRPDSVPPAVPERAEPAPEIDEAQQRLAGLRPRLRPETLVEQNERLNLGGRSREELAGVRPKIRPESLQVEPEVDETPTALAVVRAPVPKPRPANIAVQVARAPAAKSAAAAPQSDELEEGDEAEPVAAQKVTPKLPSSASVARQATVDNAINLKRINLIGVYGTPANRRALVRLPNGRYKKVAVGDRIDGGKIIAISDSELRYQKSGRNMTLSMPKG